MAKRPVKHGSEAQLLRAIMQALAMLPGVHPMRRNAGLTVLGSGSNRRAIKGCEPGTPDIEVMLNGGRVDWLEVKTPTGKVSVVQKRWHAMAVGMGHVVHVVRSVEEAVAAVVDARDWAAA